jgi:hypothetical protein
MECREVRARMPARDDTRQARALSIAELAPRAKSTASSLYVNRCMTVDELERVEKDVAAAERAAPNGRSHHGGRDASRLPRQVGAARAARGWAAARRALLAHSLAPPTAARSRRASIDSYRRRRRVGL